MKTSTNYGNALRLARNKGGWSQAEVADALGLSVPYISDIERGRRRLHALSPKQIMRLHTVLGLDPGDGLWESCVASAAAHCPWSEWLRDQVYEDDHEPESLREAEQMEGEP